MLALLPDGYAIQPGSVLTLRGQAPSRAGDPWVLACKVEGVEQPVVIGAAADEAAMVARIDEVVRVVSEAGEDTSLLARLAPLAVIKREELLWIRLDEAPAGGPPGIVLLARPKGEAPLTLGRFPDAASATQAAQAAAQAANVESDTVRWLGSGVAVRPADVKRVELRVDRRPTGTVFSVVLKVDGEEGRVLVRPYTKAQPAFDAALSAVEALNTDVSKEEQLVPLAGGHAARPEGVKLFSVRPQRAQKGGVDTVVFAASMLDDDGEWFTLDVFDAASDAVDAVTACAEAINEALKPEESEDEDE